jgi:hypothetical protein
MIFSRYVEGFVAGSFFRTCFKFCRVSSMDFEMSMDDSRIAVHYFFNNKFSEARNILQPW